MKILIASPSYDGSVRHEYMRSIMVLTDYFKQAGIEWDMMLEPATLLHVMRSVMASRALNEPDITHLLFIDTDMAFAVTAVQRLIDARKDIIGCAYPYRTIPLHENIAKAGMPFRKAISEVLPYAVQFAPGQTEMKIVNGVCEVQSIGTGLLLIDKRVLATMVKKGCVGSFSAGFPYTQWYKYAEYFGFFDYIVENRQYLGEDYSFCKRWTEQCRGKIHAVVNEEIGHVGNITVLGRYEDKLRSGRK